MKKLSLGVGSLLYPVDFNWKPLVEKSNKVAMQIFVVIRT